MDKVETQAPAQWQERMETAPPSAIDNRPSPPHLISGQIPHRPYSITKARCSGAIIPAIVG